MIREHQIQGQQETEKVLECGVRREMLLSFWIRNFHLAAWRVAAVVQSRLRAGV